MDKTKLASDLNAPPAYAVDPTQIRMDANQTQYGYDQPKYGMQPQQQYGQPQQQYGQPQQQYGQQFGQTATSTVIVSQPGQAGVAYTYARHPDYMLASIFACLFCFWPTGLCAIYHASQANNAAAVGDIEAATRHSTSARNLMTSSIAVGFIWITLVIVRVVIASNDNNGYRSY